MQLKPVPKPHWSYATLWLILFLLPFVLVFSFGWSAYSCLLWLLLAFY